MAEWKQCKLSEIADIIMGQSPKSDYYNTEGNGIPFLQGNRTFGMKYPFFDTWTTKVTKEAQAGDVIMSVRAPVGALNITTENVCLGRGVCGLRMKNGRQDFLFYLMKFSMPQLLNKETGTIFGSVNRNDISNLTVLVPEDNVQDMVSHILKNIDDKIENNNKINRNLLEQLDALYDNWFGKYKPFNIGIGGDPGYALEDGWQIRDIYSIAEVIYGAPFASKKFNTEGKGKPIVRIRDLKNQELCTYTPEEHPKGYLLQPGDIVVGMDGEFKPYIWGNEEAWLNQRVCVFNNVRKNGKAYVYCTIKPLLYSVETTEVATTVIHIGKKDYDEFRVVLPPEDILVEFEAVSKPIFDRIVEGQIENRRLTKLRNGLLPKLMLGKLDISYLNV